MNEILKIVVSMSVSGGILALLLLALRPLYKNRLHKTWQYYIWLVVLVRLLLPFAPEANLMNRAATQIAPSSPAGERVAPQYNASNPVLNVTAEIESVQDTAVPLQEARNASQPSALEELSGSLWMIWIGVAALLLIRKITSYHSFARFIRVGRRGVDDPDVLDAYDDVCQQMGIRRPLPLYVNSLAVSPMLVGILRPYILLPDLNHSARELELILRHELVHYRRRDILYKWLVQVTACLHWFNPLVYLMSREIAKSCEISCDEAVLCRLEGDLNHKRSYGDTLLATVSSGGGYGDTVASVTLSEDGKMLKERLEAILYDGEKPRTAALVAIALTGILFGGALFAGAYTGVRSISRIAEEPEAVTEAVAEDVPATEYYEETRPEDAVTERTEETLMTVVSGLGLLAQFDRAAGEYRLYQYSYYENGYLYTLRWETEDDIERYDDVISIECGNKGMFLAFPGETAAYASDTGLIEAVQLSADTMMQMNSNFSWGASFFVLVEAAGPFSERAEELLEKAYVEDNGDFFGPLLNEVKLNLDFESAVRLTEQWLVRSYEDGRDDYVMHLASMLPENKVVEELAWRALEEKNKDMSIFLMDRVSESVRKSLLGDAARTNRAAALSFALEEIPVNQFDIDVLTRQMYEEERIDAFTILVDYADESVCQRLAAMSFDNGLVEYFVPLMNCLSDSTLREYANRAFGEMKYDFQAVLMDYVVA